MDKEIKLVHFIGFSITIIGALIGAWVSLNVRISSLELKQSITDDNNKQIKTELVKMNDNLQSIRVDLARIGGEEKKK